MSTEVTEKFNLADVELAIQLHIASKRKGITRLHWKQRPAANSYSAKYREMLLSTVPSFPQTENYPPVPPPRMEGMFNLPRTSGIYFFWFAESVYYVGQATVLANRCGAHRIDFIPGAGVSFIEFPISELDFAECYYIGTLRPRANFGFSAKWRRSVPSSSRSSATSVPSVTTDRTD